MHLPIWTAGLLLTSSASALYLPRGACTLKETNSSHLFHMHRASRKCCTETVLLVLRADESKPSSGAGNVLVLGNGGQGQEGEWLDSHAPIKSRKSLGRHTSR